MKGVLCLETMGYISSKTNSQHFPEGLDTDMFKLLKTDWRSNIGFTHFDTSREVYEFSITRAFIQQQTIHVR